MRCSLQVHIQPRALRAMSQGLLAEGRDVRVLLGCHLLVGRSVDGARCGVGCEAAKERKQKGKEGWVGGQQPNLLQSSLSGDELLDY